MSWISDIMRSDLVEMTAYSSARDEADGFVPCIGIDANEFPWPPFGSVKGAGDLNRYPEPQPSELIGRLAALWNVDAKRIMVGRGSDEGIDVLVRMFCRAGIDNIVICPPTYGMYQVAASIQGAGVISVPLASDGQIDVPAVLSACDDRAKLVFIPSPNAPMGHVMRVQDVLKICEARRGQGLVVIDEAYVEFSSDTKGMLPYLDEFENLVVLRTLSKAHALAGERVGAVLANSEIIGGLQRILAPYPLSQSSIRAAMDALSVNGIAQNVERRKIIVAERKRLAEALVASPYVEKVFPSEANFILVKATDPREVMRKLKEFGILARDRSRDILGAVRLSVGTPQENDFVLKALGVDLPVSAIDKERRIYSVQRKTNETAIDVTVNLDDAGFLEVKTGIGFFDHMLAQLATHGGFGLALICKGDLDVDQHHTIEDCALALGECIRGALGDKRGIARFGAPLDEALAWVVIDISGRPFCEFSGNFTAQDIGGMSAEMVPHFFRSLAASLGAAVHIEAKGENAHHVAEACFKATGRALRQALARDGSILPSTKGAL